ncbi:MAG: cytochrome c peroxidase [Bacteroidota bacterium]
MRKYFITILILFVAAAGAGFLQMTSPVEQVKDHYRSNLDAFRQSLTEYETAVSNGSQEEIFLAHKACRLSYKRLEHLIAYFDEGVVKKYLNGAPLPVIRQNGRDLLILEPEGLQVMDEMVMEEEIDRAPLQQKIKTLQKLLPDLLQYEKNRYINERMVFEATRFQLIRIMALGISGYDTPGSLQALPEAQTSLESLQNDLSAFFQHADQSGRAEAQATVRRLEAAFRLSIRLLSTAKDFESFDRADFIRSGINPLYKDLLRLQASMGIESFNEITRPHQSINYTGESPFSDDFLNPYYFSFLTEAYDNPKLRELGSYLFFEPALSTNNQLSCASCHQPQLAFTDGKQKSLANDGESSLQRNAPTLLNAVYSNRFFYDLRADKLETQMQDVFSSTQEFHADFSAVGQKLSTSQNYQNLFKEAFADIPWFKEIDQFSITTALASYVKEIRSFNSPFDQYMRADTDKIAPKVLQGFNLFMGKAACGTCHFAPLFNGLVPPEFEENETEVLGVPATKAGQKIDPDSGRIANGRPHEFAAHYLYSFKTPTVRNAAETAPYMHNGIYDNLAEVMDFYNQGGGNGMGLNIPHQTLSSEPLNLSKSEQKAIIAFMHSLTDAKLTIPIPRQLPAFPSNSTLNHLSRKNPYSR